jgi:hypothetical protein
LIILETIVLIRINELYRKLKLPLKLDALRARAPNDVQSKVRLPSGINIKGKYNQFSFLEIKLMVIAYIF